MLKVSGLSKIYRTDDGQVRAVRGVSFELRDGEFYVLLGPSGCGKTTTIRCVAGLERPDGGEIAIDGGVVAAHGARFVPPHERDIGMVFQSYAIWPHLDVFGNVAYPLRARGGLSPSALEERVMEALRLVEMAAFARRPATQLSGGQQQRVALARALVRRPKLLLLDEPLSNLDAKLREQMRHELKELVGRIGITTLYVTHDQTEALAMADRIGVMADGTLVQEAPPRAVYERPKTAFVAAFLGVTNLLRGVVARRRDDAVGVVKIGAAAEIVAALPRGVEAGAPVVVMIRPECIVPVEPQAGGENVLTGVVSRVSFLGACQECHVQADGAELRVMVPAQMRVMAGEPLTVRLPPEHCIALEPAAIENA